MARLANAKEASCLEDKIMVTGAVIIHNTYRRRERERGRGRGMREREREGERDRERESGMIEEEMW